MDTKKILRSSIPKRTRRNRFLFFVIADSAAVIASVVFAFMLRFEGGIPEQYFNGGIWVASALMLAATIPLFVFFRLYSFTWSYVSIGDLLLLARALAVSACIVVVAFIFLRGQEFFTGFPRSVFLIAYLLLFVSTAWLRLSKRAYLQWMSDRRNWSQKERTLIVGARDEGEEVLRSIMQSQKTNYLPVGFVDPTSSRKGATIHGIRVFGIIEDIPEVIAEHGIQTMIIALGDGHASDIKQAVELGRKAGLQKIQIVPQLSELIGGQLSLRDLREVQVEDLLGRQQVTLDEEAIKRFVAGKKILITGAAGSIGSELCRQIAKFSPDAMIVIDQDETGMFWISRELKERFQDVTHFSFVADVYDKEKIDYIVQTYKPEVIFHAAAYKHVPLMEDHPDEAIKNNVFGTLTIAQIAVTYAVEKFIFISTDKAVNPTSAMGATKRLGEMICQMLNAKKQTKFISVRFGNVLDSRGSVIPVFREQIKKGGPVTVTHPNMKRYFMSTPEACLLVLEAGAIGEGGEVFVLDMGDPINIVDLAKEMIRLSGYEPDKDIPIVFTGQRPGEKMFEDTLTTEEGTQATKNQKIFIAKLSEVHEQEVQKALDSLEELAHGGSKEQIIAALKSIVPNYTSS